MTTQEKERLLACCSRLIVCHGDLIELARSRKLTNQEADDARRKLDRIIAQVDAQERPLPQKG